MPKVNAMAVLKGKTIKDVKVVAIDWYSDGKAVSEVLEFTCENAGGMNGEDAGEHKIYMSLDGGGEYKFGAFSGEWAKTKEDMNWYIVDKDPNKEGLKLLENMEEVTAGDPVKEPKKEKVGA